MEPADVKLNAYIDFYVEIKTKKPKFNFGDYLSIYKYNNYFGIGFQLNWTEEVFMIEKS